MSDPRGKIELTYVRRLPGLDALITEIEASRQQESALLAAIAALLSQRIAEAEEADPDSGYAMNTGFARTTAEVSGAMNMSPMGANHLVAHAEALGTRLPKVAALLPDGNTDWAAFDNRLSENTNVDVRQGFPHHRSAPRRCAARRSRPHLRLP